jgi:hypothetical protein
MKLFLLDSRAGADYDSYEGFVVRAKNEDQARAIAQARIADERLDNEHFWLNPKYSSCEVLTARGGQVGILLASFNAG